MKSVISYILIFISFSLFSQVESTELFPDIINLPGLPSLWPSMNDDQNRLCFLQADKKGNDKVMVTDKSANGQWTQPYVAYAFRKSEIVFGASMSNTGGQIYFGMNGDIWAIDYLGGTSWSKPLRISSVASEVQEAFPTISRDNQSLSFGRHERVRSLRTGEYQWLFAPFISRRLGNNEWGPPQKIKIATLGDEEELHALYYDNESGKIFFSVGATSTESANYYAMLKDSVCIDIRKIDFSGGYITWVSKDFKTGLVITATNPTKLASIKFGSPLTDEAVTRVNPAVAARDPVPTVQEERAPLRPIGKYYALLIGVSHYNESKLNLDRPVKDVQKLMETLCTDYEFNPEDVKILADPSRQEIMSELYKLRTKVAPEDNLLIFFAGHGFWDEGVKQGYWWPKDARQQDPSFWLSNSDLREQIRGINSRHTLLISDACFSGGIFKTRGVDDIRNASVEIQVLYKTKSRRAITSGNLSTVPDQSVFCDYLIKRLVENKDRFISSQLLFSSLKLAVINNSLAIPQEGVINDAGDEGGDFIFIRREK